MDQLFLIYLVSYVCLFFVWMRLYRAYSLDRKELELEAKEHEYQKLISARDHVSFDKQHVADESMKTYTLYEMTKEITKSLDEKEAFLIFKRKLRDNLVFKECHLFNIDDQGVDVYRSSARNFIYTLKPQRRKVGYIVVEGIRQEEREKANILCHQYAFALRRVRLYKEIEQTAITDSLTALHTRRYTLDRLIDEVDRSRHKNISFAFLMMDVDHFKHINDTYGHLSGDQVLREVGALIRNNIREIDIAGRFGGEEFSVILPDTDLQGAKFAAERIRSAIESASIKAYDNTIQATMSVGIAVFPRDAKKPMELVDKADWTLYKAKKLGRNLVGYFGMDEKT